MLSTKEQLVVSAKELIAEKGYTDTKIEDITKHANVAKGTFYVYFKTKEDVFIEILKEYCQGFEVFSKSIKLEGTLKKNIENFISEIFMAINTNQDAIKPLLLILSDVNFIKKVMGTSIKHKILSFEDIITSFLEKSRAEVDELVLENLSLVAGSTDMLIKHFLMNSYGVGPFHCSFVGIKSLSEEEVDEKIKLLVNLVYKSLRK